MRGCVVRRVRGIVRGIVRGMRGMWGVAVVVVVRRMQLDDVFFGVVAQNSGDLRDI